jgi:hypothetical protein
MTNAMRGMMELMKNTNRTCDVLVVSSIEWNMIDINSGHANKTGHAANSAIGKYLTYTQICRCWNICKKVQQVEEWFDTL